MIEIDSLYLADFKIKKVLGAYSDLIDIFVNFYNEEAWCAFFTYAHFLNYKYLIKSLKWLPALFM